jgi:hypothetical protein
MALDTGKIIIHSQFKEIPMTESVISRINQLGLSEPAMLMWTNRRGEFFLQWAIVGCNAN